MFVSYFSCGATEKPIQNAHHVEVGLIKPTSESNDRLTSNGAYAPNAASCGLTFTAAGKLADQYHSVESRFLCGFKKGQLRTRLSVPTNQNQRETGWTTGLSLVEIIDW